MGIDVGPTLSTPVFGTLLPNAAHKRIWGSNLATGDTDLYTVPSGKRLLVFSGQAFNPSGGSITYFPQVKFSGTYYRLGSNVTSTTGTGGNPSVAASLIVLEAGDIFAINCATTAGLNAWWQAVEFDNTALLKSKRILGVSTGDNTLYTCPANTSAFTLPSTGIAGGGNVGVVSDGSSRNWTLYNVPSGGSAGTTNKVRATNAVAANTGTPLPIHANLTAGDFIVVNVNTGNAAQATWVTIVESPNI